MSVAPSTRGLAAQPADLDRPRRAGLPRSAAAYLVLVTGATIAAASPFYGALLEGGEPLRCWIIFAALTSAAAVAHVFPVLSPRNQMYHTSTVFLLAAALLLPPPLLLLTGLVVCLPEWLKERRPWYIQLFNTCNYTLNMLAAWGAAELVQRGGHAGANTDVRMAVGAIAACVTFVGLNHVLLAVMLRLGRGHSFRETGLFSFESVSMDLVLTGLGVVLATFTTSNPWLIPLALGPLLFIHRSLSVPMLQAEARNDPKTGLFNARHLAAALGEELERAKRLNRPLSLMMTDLDLLRDINNTYGHLAGDAVLTGIAGVFRGQLRHYDVAARFGGEEFCVLLPETTQEQALEIAERIRCAVAEQRFDVETSSEPIRATVSIGVASFPKDAVDANELIHQADLAVYRAKLQGRNRVLGTSSEPLLVPPERSPRLAVVPDEEPAPASTEPPRPKSERERRAGEPDRRAPRRPRPARGPRLVWPSGRLTLLVALVATAGTAAGVLGALVGASTDVVGLFAFVALVGVAQALAVEVFHQGTLSVSAVGTLAGAALFGPRAALALAVTTCAVEWSARRGSFRQVAFNVGTLTLASLAAAAVFAGLPNHPAAVGVLAGAVYFAINIGLLSVALALEGHDSWLAGFRERFAWLLPFYLVYGFVGGVIAIAYDAAGLYALAAFAVPLLLMRKTQEAYLAHTRASAEKLRQAAKTIQTQNVSLEQANKLLRERSTAAMESLSATVDARDAYTAGHSRRVQELALAIGRQLGLSQAELDLLGHAALFHDIGKLAIPDRILLKPGSLTETEWEVMQRHADEGARIIDRLGFLDDAVPAIRHHHERWDGQGYPDRLKADEIPLGARIIHVADAFDSMLTDRIYRAARPVDEVIAELRRAAGTQFCPRCVAALEAIAPAAVSAPTRDDRPALVAAS
jgi:diguanylate cyclase (GGDEF)-like protein/putative nucleotidyltransferase with HDIG domain